jgi:hypothetical protein
MTFSTEFEFTLPKGYIDAEGALHREGTMRLATAADEILLMQDPRVQSLPAYLIVLLLSRVVTRLGALEAVNTGVIERLFTEDLAYLQNLYNELNGLGGSGVTRCPECGHEFSTEVAAVGGSWATP